MNRLWRNKTVRSSVFFVLLMLAGACAGAGVAPLAKMVTLEYALDDARRAEAAAYAPLELRLAEDKYQLAGQAIADRKHARAERLIDKALLDAQLAREKALAGRAEKDAFDLRRSLEELRGDAERLHLGR
mgnify:CR=1 FL=1